MRNRGLPVACLIAVASGLALSLAREPIGAWPLALFAMAPFLLLLQDARPRRGALLGLCFGFAYNAAVFAWILLFGKPAWIGISLALAIYVVLFAMVAPTLWRSHAPVRSALAVAALWVVMEYVRGHWPLGGLTWTDLVYTQSGNLLGLKITTITGGLGVSFILVAANGLVALLWQRRRIAVAAAWLVGILLVPLLVPLAGAQGSPVDVAAIQVDLPPTEDRAASNRIMAEDFAQAHESLAEDPPALVVWPENALDEDPAIQPAAGEFIAGLLGDTSGDPRQAHLRQRIVRAIRETGAPTLVGTISGPEDGVQYNEVVAYRPDGSVQDRYAKVHLVPYGEFAPARGFLSRLVREVGMIRRDLTPGSSIDPMQMAGLPVFGAVVCFENAFPEIDRTLVREGAEFIVVASNNSSYERTSASDQHLAISRVRAVELQRWIVHAGLTGPSAFIDPQGRVHQQTELFTPQVIRGTVIASDHLTFYARFGDWFPALALLGSALAFVAPRHRRRPRQVEPLPADARSLVVLPTYNEAATIAEVITRLLETGEAIDVVVVDDGSPDGTGDIVEHIAAAGAPVRLIRRAAKAGLASAYVSGFELGLREGYDIVVEMDSDLSHQPEELPALLHAATRGADLAIGSRYVPGGSVTNWSRVRVALSRGGNTYARIALGIPLRDVTSGFRAYRRELIAHLMDQEVHADGYGFQVELAWRALRDGYAVSEVPITFKEREHGQSKISRRIVLEALWLVTIWGVRDRLRPAQADDLAIGPASGREPDHGQRP